MTPTLFAVLAASFEELEHTSSSSRMIDVLADLFSRLSPTEARLAAYLLRGKVAPDYEGLELGVAEKLVTRALAAASDLSMAKVQAASRRTGDLGDAAAVLLGRAPGAGLRLGHVFERLKEIARIAGAGSQEEKIHRLADLLKRCSPREAKYVVRIVLGKLRLGVAEMTFLSGLSQALTGTKKDKPILETAFNVLSDLGEVAEHAVRSGIQSLRNVTPVVGKPIRMMLAQRVGDLAEVPAHIAGLLHVEYKYDGERVQAHVRKRGDIILYSRRQENITHQFPDVVQAVRLALPDQDAIIEGEVVAIDPESGKLRDFQTLMQRRRKHAIDEYVRTVPVKYFLFDALYLNGKSLLTEPLSKRKETLVRKVKASQRVAVATYTATQDLE
jgi:DNA ligase-1